MEIIPRRVNVYQVADFQINIARHSWVEDDSHSPGGASRFVLPRRVLKTQNTRVILYTPCYKGACVETSSICCS